MDQKAQGIFLNIDINSVVYPFLNQIASQEKISKKDLYPFIDQYVDTQVTDIALNIFCQYSNTPSALITDAYAKYEQRLENGHPVDYKAVFNGLYRLVQTEGLDVYAIWLKRCREVGIGSWISVRMNDAHDPDKQTSFLRSNFFYAAKKNNWMIGPQYGYYRHCFDYEKPVIRHLMLAYIAEQLDKYDVDGLELDWLREIYCFNYLDNQQATAQLNDFMRQVKLIVDHASMKWGHKIKIMVRVMRDIEQNLAFGLDVWTWLEERLVDAVAVGPRWASCDSAMPIAEWAKLCKSKAELFACLEILVKQTSSSSCATAKVARGYAAQYLNAGADRIYLFNYFQNPFTPSKELNSIYRTCANKEILYKLPRRHVVTHQDLYPVGFEPYEPLPCSIQAQGEIRLPVETGPLNPQMNIKLICGFKDDEQLQPDSDLSVFFNGLESESVEQTNIISYDYTHDQLVANGYVEADTILFSWTVSANDDKPVQEVRVCNNKKQAIDLAYVEIALVPE